MKTKKPLITTLLTLAAAMPAQAHESTHKLEAPGYRPPTEQAVAFIQNVKSSKIAHARFEGTLNEEGTELVGKLIHGEGEGEHVAPLTLRKKQ